jgi:hypothetical protein
MILRTSKTANKLKVLPTSSNKSYGGPTQQTQNALKTKEKDEDDDDDDDDDEDGEGDVAGGGDGVQVSQCSLQTSW